MAYQSATGQVTGLYASSIYDAFIRINNTWWDVPQSGAAAVLTVAADARRAGTPVFVASDNTTGYFAIQSL
jgi:hypothetical protein